MRFWDAALYEPSRPPLHQHQHRVVVVSFLSPVPPQLKRDPASGRACEMSAAGEEDKKPAGGEGGGAHINLKVKGQVCLSSCSQTRSLIIQ